MVTEEHHCPKQTRCIYKLRQDNDYKKNELRIDISGSNSSVLLPLINDEEIQMFVNSMNEQRVEPIHIVDCFKDFFYEKMLQIKSIYHFQQ